MFPGRSLGTDVWLHSEKCSFYQSMELKMLLPLLQFGREHRGGGGQDVQRTQVKELKAGQTVLCFEGEQWGHALKEAIPTLWRK